MENQTVVFEEDIELAVETATKILGPQGRQLPNEKTALLNMYIASPKYGELWYGDLNGTADVKKIDKLAETLNIPLYLLSEEHRYDYERSNSPLVIKINQLS